MANFLSINVVNSAGPLTAGEQLVNVDQIEGVTYVAATGVLTMFLKAAGVFQDTAAAGAGTGAGGIMARVITSTIKNVTTGAAGAGTIPTFTTSIGDPSKAVMRAMTANPGGVKASVNLGRDQAATPVPIYFSSFNITSATVV